MKTLVIYDGNIMGITEQEVSLGDVVTLDENDPVPLFVSLIQDKPSKVGYNPNADPNQLIVPDDEADGNAIDIEWEGDFERVAYLKYNEKLSKKYVKKTSQSLEKRMAKTLGGSITPGSGAFSGHKGDVRAPEWLGEHKYTDSKSYRLEDTIWYKISREAFEVGKTPALEVILDQSKSHLRLIFLELPDFIEKSGANEEQLLSIFYFTQLTAKPGKQSINLDVDYLQDAINKTLTMPGAKVPAFFLTFNEHLTLFGMLSKDFEIVFPVEPEPIKKTTTTKARKKTQHSVPRKKQKAPKKTWPKRPFPQRKKKSNDENCDKDKESNF